jgi:hypothetical protein
MPRRSDRPACRQLGAARPWAMTARSASTGQEPALCEPIRRAGVHRASRSRYRRRAEWPRLFLSMSSRVAGKPVCRLEGAEPCHLERPTAPGRSRPPGSRFNPCRCPRETARRPRCLDPLPRTGAHRPVRSPARCRSASLSAPNPSIDEALNASAASRAARWQSTSWRHAKDTPRANRKHALLGCMIGRLMCRITLRGWTAVSGAGILGVICERGRGSK